MTRGARIGIAAIVPVVLVLAIGGWYVWKRPLSVFAWFNRRALARAGLVETQVPSPVGPQNVWTGGQGPTLVLLHGAGDQAGTWANVVAALAPRYRLVIPDLAGHGGSAPASGPLGVDQVLRGVEADLAAGPQDPAIIVGNSLGAWVALLYAVDHPDRVARLILVNGGALRGDRPEVSLTPRTREEAARVMAELTDAASPRVPGFVLDDVVRQGQSGPLARLTQTAAEMEKFLLDGRLGEVRVPVDLLWGESDRLFPVGYAQRMMAQLPASRLTTIQGCGHVPQQECPSRFQASLLDILQQTPPLLPAKEDAGAPTAPAGGPR